MTLGATLAGLLGGWTTGCVVLLGFLWLFLALLGIRNSRFPWRVAGGAAFVVGSALWLGMHPTHASAWEIDAGYLGFAAQTALLRPEGPALLQSLLGALLAACSVLGLLVAIDWLPLLPLAPLLATVEQRLASADSDRNRARAELAARQAAERARSAGVAAGSSVMNSSATLDAPRAARIASPAKPVDTNVEAVQSAAPPLVATDAAAVVAAAAGLVDATIPATAPDEAEAPPSSTAVSSPVAESETEGSTNWQRFRPRKLAPESPGQIPVDNGPESTHNSSLSMGASRADVASTIETPPVSAAVEVAGTPSTSGASEAVPAPDSKDSPVVDDRDSVSMNSELVSGGTAVLDGDPVPVEANAQVPAMAPPSGETLSPRRKKKEEEEEQEPPADPEAEPDEEGDDEEGDDDFEEGDDDPEEEDDADEEEEGEEEDWEDEEEEGDDEEEDEEEEDEDWEDDEEEDEDDEEDDDWDGDDDESSSRQPPAEASAPVASESASEVGLIAAESVVETAAPIVAELPPVISDTDLAAPAAETAMAASSATTSPVAASGTAAPPVASTNPDPGSLFSDLPGDERALLARATELILTLDQVSLSKLQRELSITYYSAARVFERLEKEGFIAPYSGSLARSVKVTRAEWEARLRA
jgi:hypothetical protein